MTKKASEPLLEAVAKARDRRKKAALAFQAADDALVEAMQRARPSCSFEQIGNVAGMTKNGVRWRVENLSDERRKKVA